MPDPPFRNRWPEKHHEFAREHGFISWEAWCAIIEQERSLKICGGKRPKGPCRRAAGWGTKHVGRGRCRDHQGRAEDTPKEILLARAMAEQDPELMSVRDQIIAARNVQAMLIEELEKAGPQVIGLRARNASKSLETAVTSGDEGELARAAAEVVAAMEEAGGIVELYDKISGSMGLVAKLTKTEQEILKTRHDMVSREQLANLMGRISRSLEYALARNVPDDRVRKLTLRDFVKALQDVYGDPDAAQAALVAGN